MDALSHTSCLIGHVDHTHGRGSPIRYMVCSRGGDPAHMAPLLLRAYATERAAVLLVGAGDCAGLDTHTASPIYEGTPTAAALPRRAAHEAAFFHCHEATAGAEPRAWYLFKDGGWWMRSVDPVPLSAFAYGHCHCDGVLLDAPPPHPQAS